jgi:hypothetical protein
MQKVIVIQAEMLKDLSPEGIVSLTGKLNRPCAGGEFDAWPVFLEKESLDVVFEGDDMDERRGVNAGSIPFVELE